MPDSSPPDYVLQGIDALDKAMDMADDYAEEKITVWEKPVSLAPLLSTPPGPMPWFVRDRIQLGRGGLLSGIGGSSKTRLLYHLAVGAVIGRLPWSWEVATVGKAVLVLTEDTEDDVHRALYSVCEGIAATTAEMQSLAQNLIIYALAGQSMKLLGKGERGELTYTNHYYEFVERIKGGTVFVGIDPAIGVTEGDEQDQNNQRALGRLADDIAVNSGATCLLVAHATKASQSQEELSSHNSRGGSAITDAVRMEFAMRTMTKVEADLMGVLDVEERKRHAQLVATKGNHLPPSAYVPLWLYRGEYGALSEASIADRAGELQGQHGDDGAPGMGFGMSEDLVLAFDVLVSMSKTSAADAIQWMDECIKRGVLKGKDATAKKANFQKIKRKLLAMGYIRPGFARGVYVPGDF